MTIEQKQCLLKYLGYYEEDVDGEWGRFSEEATRDFQYANDLTKDGIFGSETEAAAVLAVYEGKFKEKEAAPLDDPSDAENGVFWDGIKYFDKSEFACNCGTYCNGHPTEMKKGVVTVADRTRDHFGSPAFVSSGMRCKQHNANVGGVSNSRHLSGKAIDFCVLGKSSGEVLAYVQKQPEIRYAYAIDSNYVHMDSDVL